MNTIVSASLLTLGLGAIVLGWQKADIQLELENTKTKLVAAEVTIANQDTLAESLIKGEGYTVTRKEGEDTVRYLVSSCVKKEIQMFVPVSDK
jgi:hypothetical protein